MQISPMWSSALRQLETTLGVWGNVNGKPCSNNAFPSPLALCAFEQMVQRVTSHHPHFILIGYKIPFSGLSCLARKAWKPGQQCPVVRGDAGWCQHGGQELISVDTQAVPPWAGDGLLLPLLWGCACPGPHQLKLFHNWNVTVLGKPVLLSGLAFSSCIRRKLWGELFMWNSFFQNHKHSETTLLSPHLNFKNQGRIV